MAPTCWVCKFVKWQANSLMTGCDDESWYLLLVQMLMDIITRVVQKDLAHSDWCMNGHKVIIWIDTSSLATGVIIESRRSMVVEACWLYLVWENKHINLAEFNAMLRGVNLALQWKMTVVHLKTDLAWVHCWVSDMLSGETRMCRKVTSEMLIKCQLGMLRNWLWNMG